MPLDSDSDREGTLLDEGLARGGVLLETGRGLVGIPLETGKGVVKTSSEENTDGEGNPLALLEAGE